MTTPQDGLGPAPKGRVACGSCGAELSVHAGGQAAVAPCPTCARMLDLAPFLPDRAPPPPEPEIPVVRFDLDRPRARAPLMVRQDAPFPMPLEAQCVESEGRVEVRLPDRLNRLPIAAIMGGVGLVMVLLFALSARAVPRWGLGLVGWVAVSGYLLAQGLVNRRVFRARKGEVTIVTRPLPWFRGWTIARDVRALVVERNWTEAGRGSYRFIWELYAREAKGQKVPLLEGAGDAVLVGWLAQRLASAMGVPVEPAAGPARGREQGP